MSRLPLRRLGSTLLGVALLAAITPAAPAAAYQPMAQKVAIIRFNFTNDTRNPVAASVIGNAAFNSPDTDGVDHSLAAYVKTMSYGRMTVTGRVFPLVKIADTNAGCLSDTNPADGLNGNSYQSWAAKARAKLAAAGYDLSGYNHFIYMWPRLSYCGFGGRGGVDGNTLYLNLTPSYWTSSTYAINDWYVMTHEFLHNLGSHHAGVVSCKTASGARTALGGTCVETFPTVESKDPYDIMVTYYTGMTPSYSKRMPSTYERYKMGLLKDSEVKTVNGKGTYTLTLNPAAYTGSVTKLIKIVRPGRPVLNYYTQPRNAQYPELCLEWRRTSGWFDNFASTDTANKGVLVRLCDEVFGAWSHPTRLVDTTPGSKSGTADWTDAALTAGKTLTDGFSGVKITVKSVSVNTTTPANSVITLTVIIP